MPVHPENKKWEISLQEDREAVILADKLGFYDVFIGEHLTDKSENITNSMIFLSSLISETKNIKLGTGTSNLSHMHPVLIASHAAMLDHLSEGRFIFGISPGALRCDAEVLGIINEDRGQIFAESIDVILEIWKSDPPYNIDLPKNRFKVSSLESTFLEVGVGYLQKPYQKPLPEIVGTVVAPFSKGVIAMGERDFHPISAHFLLPKWVKTHWENYKEGKENVGLKADVKDWRVARTIFVNDDSTDNSEKILLDLQKQFKIKIINMSRRFGTNPCVLAGFENCSGDCIIYMDSDLQDPPELITEMIKQHEKGFEIVHTRRTKRLGESKVKLFFTNIAYSIINKLSEIDLQKNVGDFKLISRKALDKILEQKEYNPYIRGLSVWVGFKQTYVDYVRDAREAGETKFSLFDSGPDTQFLRGVTSYSLKPLYIGVIFGFFAFLFSIFLILAIVFLPYIYFSIKLFFCLS